MASATTMPMPWCGPGLDCGGTSSLDRESPLLLPASSFGTILALVTGVCTPNRTLAALPGELMLEIFKGLDLASALALGRACKKFRQLYVDNKSRIVLAVLPSDPDFSPADDLFQVAAMASSDLNSPCGTWLDKEIWFRRKLLCPGKQLPPPFGAQYLPSFEPEQTALPTRVACLEDADVDRLLGICKVVKGWERIFPHYRFSHHPERMRRLRDHETRRLRRAIYHWMRYHYYFHGDLPRPSSMEPSGYDMRCNYIRTLDSGAAAELADLWITVKSAVLSLCPSLATVRAGVESLLSEEQATGIGWGTTEQDQYIIASTILKLGPEKLLYYINHAHEYSKTRLVDEIRRERPCIESDIESLTMAMRVVFRERHDHCLMLSMPPPPTPFGQPREPFGGILDWDDVTEPLRGIIQGGLGLRWLPDDEDDDEDEGREMSRGGLRF